MLMPFCGLVRFTTGGRLAGGSITTTLTAMLALPLCAQPLVGVPALQNRPRRAEHHRPQRQQPQPQGRAAVPVGGVQHDQLVPGEPLGEAQVGQKHRQGEQTAPVGGEEGGSEESVYGLSS